MPGYKKRGGRNMQNRFTVINPETKREKTFVYVDLDDLYEQFAKYLILDEKIFDTPEAEEFMDDLQNGVGFPTSMSGFKRTVEDYEYEYIDHLIGGKKRSSKRRSSKRRSSKRRSSKRVSSKRPKVSKRVSKRRSSKKVSKRPKVSKRRSSKKVSKRRPQRVSRKGTKGMMRPRRVSRKGGKKEE
jgi:hypothetical protein